MVGISIWHCEVMKRSCFELESKTSITLTIILHIGCVLNLMSSRCTTKIVMFTKQKYVGDSKLLQVIARIGPNQSERFAICT